MADLIDRPNRSDGNLTEGRLANDSNDDRDGINFLGRFRANWLPKLNKMAEDIVDIKARLTTAEKRPMVKGDDGADGKPGTDGTDGKNGTNGVVSKILGPSGGDKTAPTIQFLGPGVSIDVVDQVSKVSIAGGGGGGISDPTAEGFSVYLGNKSADGTTSQGWGLVDPVLTGLLGASGGGGGGSVGGASPDGWPNGTWRGTGRQGSPYAYSPGNEPWIHLMHFRIYEQTVLDRVLVGYINNSAEVGARVGIYRTNETTGLPGARIHDLGTYPGVPQGQSSDFPAVTIDVTLDPGVFWLACRSRSSNNYPLSPAWSPNSETFMTLGGVPDATIGGAFGSSNWSTNGVVYVEVSNVPLDSRLGAPLPENLNGQSPFLYQGGPLFALRKKKLEVAT